MANTQKGDSYFGFYGGYSKLIGNYTSDLNNSYLFGFQLIPLTYNNFLLDATIDFSNYSLTDSSDSNLNTFKLTIGPSFYISIADLFEIHSGINFNLSYLYLKATESEERISSIKPGYSISTKFLIPVSRGFNGFTGVSYNHKWVSNKSFTDIQLIAGVSFNYNSFLRSSSDTVPADSMLAIHFSKAVELFNKRKTLAALDHFKKVQKINPKHQSTNTYIQQINTALLQYNKGKSLQDKKEYIKAITAFDEARNLFPQAAIKISTIRKILAAQIRGLERSGIKAFHRKDYKRCIRIFNKLKVIDPDNNKVKLYLPKAKKRYNALKRLGNI